MWTLLLVQFMRGSEEFGLRFSSSRAGWEWILERTAERSFAQHKSLLHQHSWYGGFTQWESPECVNDLRENVGGPRVKSHTCVQRTRTHTHTYTHIHTHTHKQVQIMLLHWHLSSNKALSMLSATSRPR